MYRVYYITVKDKENQNMIYESAGLTEETLHELLTNFCGQGNCPYWVIEITSQDYEEKPWWL